MTPPCYSKYPQQSWCRMDGTPQLGGRDVEPHIWVRSTSRQALTHHNRSVNFSILKRNQFGKMHQVSLEWFQSFYLYIYIYIHTHILIISDPFILLLLIYAKGTIFKKIPQIQAKIYSLLPYCNSKKSETLIIAKLLCRH